MKGYDKSKEVNKRCIVCKRILKRGSKELCSKCRNDIMRRWNKIDFETRNNMLQLIDKYEEVL